MPAFWHWFVAAGTIVFIIWCIWLISWSAKQGPQNVADDDLVGHKWDGDLEEWNNPAPKWWLYLYFITIAWAIGYLISIPGPRQLRRHARLVAARPVRTGNAACGCHLRADL